MKPLIENWWLFVLRGVAACLFGALLLVRPGASLASLVIFYGAYALVEGALTLSSGMAAGARNEPWGPLVLAGALGITIGVLTLAWPAMSAIALFFVIASWAIGLGVLQILAAIRLRTLIEREWLLALSGVLSAVLGVVMLASPLMGLALLVAVLATYAFLVGAVNLVLGIRLHKLDQPLHL